MDKNRMLAIHTVVVRGDFESFKAAFSRSVLGVTFKKFKRKGREFYQHRVHNEKVTNIVCSFLYEYLMRETQNMSNYDLRTDLTLHWNDTGKILKISNIKVTIFLRAAELHVDEVEVKKKLENIVIDLFYSDIDAASQKLKTKISEIIDSIGRENFEYHEWNILYKEGKEMADKYGVKLVPTVIINADPKRIFENPDERTLRNEIEELYVPQISEPIPRFEKNEKAKTSMQYLFATK
ncbi:MAG: hypothetical protein QXZ70_00500 [Candidatus Bathyarchaeia archaeon]